MNSNDLPDPKLPTEEVEEPPPGLDLLGDCRLMLRFALKEALEIPAELRTDISRLDQLLKSLRLPPLSNVPASLIGRQDTLSADVGATQNPSGQTELVGLEAIDLLIKVHQGLSKVVAPATALSLQMSEPPPNRRRFLGGTPMIVKLAALVATLSAITFVLTAADIARQATPPISPKTKTTATGSDKSATPAGDQKSAKPEETPNP
jgi:hypothetical protein